MGHTEVMSKNVLFIYICAENICSRETMEVLVPSETR